MEINKTNGGVMSGRKVSVLAQLRDLVPRRPLTPSESLRIAELQADRLLRLLNVTEAPVPAEVIADLPRIEVRYLQPWPFAGATQWSKGMWIVAIKASDAPTRQRFTLAHEFKHILDDPFVNVLYQGIPAAERAEWRERVCHYFAGCLLVPKRWLRQAWVEGCQNPVLLARRFNVSVEAMQIRLEQLGLANQIERCGTVPELPAEPSHEVSNEIYYVPFAA